MLFIKNLINKIYSKTIKKRNITPYYEKLIFSTNCVYDFNSIKIAIHIDISNLDNLKEIIDYLQKVPLKYDLYITTYSEYKDIILDSLHILNISNLKLNLVKNQKRPLYNFLTQLKDVSSLYNYILHIHTNTCYLKNRNLNTIWNQYLYKNLMGSYQNIKFLINYFEKNPNTEMIYPPDFPLIHKTKEDLNDNEKIKELLKKINRKLKIQDITDFSAGNMFWIRASSLTDYYKKNSDLIDATFDAQDDFPFYIYDRLFDYCINKKNTYAYLYNNTILKQSTKARITFFAHYDKNNLVSNTDLNYLIELKKISQTIYFITTSNLAQNEIAKINKIVDFIIIRENIGFDFASWKAGIMEYGFDKLKQYDEVLIINNSCFAPVFPLSNVFSDMESIETDFWGMTIFPEQKKFEDWIGTNIKEHIQSYFVCFRKNCFISDLWKNYWKDYIPQKTFEKTILNGEIGLTQTLKTNFTYKAYIPTYNYRELSGLSVYSALDNPDAVLLLGDPLIKKKILNFSENTKLMYFLLKKIQAKKYLLEYFKNDKI